RSASRSGCDQGSTRASRMEAFGCCPDVIDRTIRHFRTARLAETFVGPAPGGGSEKNGGEHFTTAWQR
ncbi:MAG: hypothetical protein ACK6A7_11150, partial [Planctomycetota bacterium]